MSKWISNRYLHKKGTKKKKKKNKRTNKKTSYFFVCFLHTLRHHLHHSYFNEVKRKWTIKTKDIRRRLRGVLNRKLCRSDFPGWIVILDIWNYRYSRTLSLGVSDFQPRLILHQSLVYISREVTSKLRIERKIHEEISERVDGVCKVNAVAEYEEKVVVLSS